MRSPGAQRSRGRTRVRGATRVRSLLVLLAGALLVAVSAPQAAGAACLTKLPVRISLPDGSYAATYTKQVRVRVVPEGARIGNLQVSLYTFSGRRMAISKARRTVRSAVTMTMPLDRVFRPLQIGGFTLVVTGEPNLDRSCGPKKVTRVLRFRDCKDTLPVTFPKKPGGKAADYEGYLSVPIRSDGPLIRDLTSTIYSFDGALVGRSTLSALFGQQTLDHVLLTPLKPGGYNVIVEGLIDDQPSSCGRKTAQATMTFQ
jgi:hypothetical protein